MPPSVRNSYLETEVMTATPQKLQFMLLDGAILAIQKTKQLWADDRDEEGCETLIKAQQIISELLAGLNREVDADLARKVAAIYLFVFRSLMTANAEKDVEKLDGALEVLEIERETWRRVCDQLGSTKAAGVPEPKTVTRAMPVADMTPISDPEGIPGVSTDLAGGFSIEA